MLFLNVWGFVYCLKVKISNVGRQRTNAGKKIFSYRACPLFQSCQRVQLLTQCWKVLNFCLLIKFRYHKTLLLYRFNRKRGQNRRFSGEIRATRWWLVLRKKGALVYRQENKDYYSSSVSLLRRAGEETTQTSVNFFPHLIGNATQTILNLLLSPLHRL